MIVIDLADEASEQYRVDLRYVGLIITWAQALVSKPNAIF